MELLVLLMQEKNVHSHLILSTQKYKSGKGTSDIVTEEESKPISTSDLSLHMAGTTSSKGEHKR